MKLKTEPRSTHEALETEYAAAARAKPVRRPPDLDKSGVSQSHCNYDMHAYYMYLGMLAAPVLHARQGTCTMPFQVSMWMHSSLLAQHPISGTMSAAISPWHEVVLYSAQRMLAGEGNSIGISASECAASAAAAALAATADPVRRMKKRKRDAKRNGQVGLKYLLPPAMFNII